MRILQLHNFHAEGPGGAVDVLLQESALLRDAGHSVSQYTMPAAKELDLSPVQAGVKAIWNHDASRGVSTRIANFRPDVVHVHIPFPLLSPTVFRTSAKHHVPAVTTVHNYAYSCIAGSCHRDGSICEDCVGSRLKLPGVLHKCYHQSFGASSALTASLLIHRGIGTFRNSVNRYIALTDFSKRLLVRDGIPDDHIVVKPNSVTDPGREYVERPHTKSIVFAGRLTELKGVRTLLDAWRSQPLAGFALKIVGDGPLRSLVEQRCTDDLTIEYLGWVSQDRVYDLMAEASCVVLPSEWYEGQPLVTLRSLAVGTPLIVCDLENVCEDVLRDGVADSFRTGDPSSLAMVLESLASDTDSWTRRRLTARKVYERRYTSEKSLAALTKIYEQAVAS